MIRISVLENGEIKNSLNLVNLLSTGISPEVILRELLKKGIRWEIDFSKATEKEVMAWGSADVIVRIVRALQENRPVFLTNKKYLADDQESVEILTQEIVGIISGNVVNIVSDKKDGLRINIINRG